MSAQERKQESSKQGISNCLDVPRTLDLICVLRRRCFATDHLPPHPSPAPHLTLSAKGARAASFIYWSHLFICHIYSAHNLWHIHSFKRHLPPRAPEDGRRCKRSPSRFTSCEADLMRVKHLRWRLQTHLMAVGLQITPTYTNIWVKLLHRDIWQRSCAESFCRAAAVSSGCRVGDPEPAAAFHLLARSTYFGLRCHLNMHRHRFYPAGSKNLSHLTQPLQQLLINRRATSPPARTLRIPRLTAHIWSLFHSA